MFELLKDAAASLLRFMCASDEGFDCNCPAHRRLNGRQYCLPVKVSGNCHVLCYLQEDSFSNSLLRTDIINMTRTHVHR